MSSEPRSRLRGTSPSNSMTSLQAFLLWLVPEIPPSEGPAEEAE